jgi:hypothetical protein
VRDSNFSLIYWFSAPLTFQWDRGSRSNNNQPHIYTEYCSTFSVSFHFLFYMNFSTDQWRRISKYYLKNFKRLSLLDDGSAKYTGFSANHGWIPRYNIGPMTPEYFSFSTLYSFFFFIHLFICAYIVLAISPPCPPIFSLSPTPPLLPGKPVLSSSPILLMIRHKQ